MKYMKQIMIIFAVTCIGEVLNHLIPLPIPASIYGLVLMLLSLMTGVIKIHQVKDVAGFLIEIMPLMFIPAGVGLMASWDLLSKIVIPVIVISIFSTIFIMVVTGKITEYLVRKGEK